MMRYWIARRFAACIVMLEIICYAIHPKAFNDAEAEWLAGTKLPEDA